MSSPVLRSSTTAPFADVLGELADLVGRGRILVLTGAGVSTASGIPDYRDAQGRLRHTAVMTYDRFLGSADERQRYWARSHLGWPRIASARPNAAHRTITALQRAGLLSGVVTQNVDGLHAAAGTADVVDLHGRLDTVVCLGCGARRPRLELALRLDVVNPAFRAAVAGEPGRRPDGDLALDETATRRFVVVACRRCGGILKPDVVFFGEHVPAHRFTRSLELLDGSAALLVLGSSLMVGSGYRFVTAARRRGVPIAIVNRGVTRGDPLATVRVDGGLIETLTPLCRTLRLEHVPPPPAGEPR
jgi:NAD-dependent SIR2 family protein deacetylase